MKTLLSCLSLLLALATVRGAETTHATASATNGLLILCDNGFEYFEGKAVYRGNVQAIDADMSLRCELLTIYFQTNLGKLNIIVAETNVLITQKDSIAIAERAVYTATNELVTLTGNVLLDMPEGWLAGPEIVYDRATGRLHAAGRVLMGEHPSASGQRTNALFLTLPRGGTPLTPPPTSERATPR